MSEQLVSGIQNELEQIVLIDPHTHINPHSAASENLADIMGYHYYTELAHSAGLPKSHIEEPGIAPKEKVGRLIPQLADLDNTVQLSWLMDICSTFFDFHEEQITSENWEALYEAAEKQMARPDWEAEVLKISKLEQIFLTNDFDDPLSGFDTNRYIPCLRTDDLVFHLARKTTQERLEKATGVSLRDAASLRSAIGKLFTHFTQNNAKACAISLPPDFAPTRITQTAVAGAWDAVLKSETPDAADACTVSRFVFWTLAEMCAEHKLPFDLMIGVNRGVYADGVYQGQDLYDKRTSLIQYRELFNAFPQVIFPISMLTSTSNQELVSYAWIFPNVVTNGHWWYSNIPAYIAIDCRSRLEAVPKTKVIGYYSDMYKLEFALPKFGMYRRVLARVLAENFVIAQGWTESKAIELGRQVLRGNVERIFFPED